MVRRAFYSLATGTLLIMGAAPAQAQRAIDAQVGSWAVEGGADATVYSAALWKNAWGPLGYSVRASGLVDGGPDEESLFGLGPELTLLRGQRDRAGLSVYGATGVSVALQSGGSDAAALWSAGLGLELQAPSIISVTLEARRLVEDTGFNGFWNLSDGDRKGWLLALGLSFRWGGDSRTPAPTEPANLPPEIDRGPSPSEVTVPARAAGALRGGVVETALSAMGEPYRWGGTGTDEGFDCSGLVWYAYTSHGVDVPRVSRDQARAGRAVPKRIEDLEPGDILTFSNRPGVVTHVGLYIGEARFIHATTSGGVRIGALDSPQDENDSWYLSRWVGARRVVD